MQCRYEEAVLADPDLNKKHSLEQDLWKLAFYQVVEAFRKQVADAEDDDVKQQLKDSLLRILDEVSDT